VVAVGVSAAATVLPKPQGVSTARGDVYRIALENTQLTQGDPAPVDLQHVPHGFEVVESARVIPAGYTAVVPDRVLPPGQRAVSASAKSQAFNFGCLFVVYLRHLQYSSFYRSRLFQPSIPAICLTVDVYSSPISLPSTRSVASVYSSRLSSPSIPPFQLRCPFILYVYLCHSSTPPV
jgi:hypothetical protein